MYKVHPVPDAHSGTDEEGDGDGAAEHGEIVLQTQQTTRVPVPNTDSLLLISRRDAVSTDNSAVCPVVFVYVCIGLCPCVVWQ